MSTITFLVGAGASAIALEPVKGFNKRLSEYADKDVEFYKTCSELNGYFSRNQEQRFKDYFNFFITQVRQLINQLDLITIDQLARKKYNNNVHGEYENIKCLLSAFFSFEQLHPDFRNLKFDHNNQKFIVTRDINRRSIDPRYEFLWSILANGSEALNQNIRILSWNYDLQAELSYQDYFWDPHYGSLNAEDIPFEIGTSLKILPNYSLEKYGVNSPNVFSLTKLNGVAGFYHESKTRKSYSTYLFGNEPVTLDIVYSILEDYCLSSPTSGYRNGLKKTTLKFAWEADEQAVIKSALQRTKDTEVLVVIGYSFPEFNRDIDEQILSNMPSLKTVYIMDITSNIDQRETEIRKMNSNQFTLHKHTDLTKFAIPSGLR